MNRMVSVLVRVIAPLVILAISLGVAASFVSSKPKADRAQRPASAPLVEVTSVSPSAQTLTVSAMGTVRPAHLLVVQPQVSGAVIDHHPELVPGGLIAEGEILVTIDDRDYTLAVERQQAQVTRARLDLRVENGRQAIAEQEWEAMAKELVMMERADESLARREPQVEAARAGVQAARGAVESAQLNLDRTRIQAPFNAVVREEAVEIGQVVGPGYRLATLVGTDAAWVEVSVPVDALARLRIPGHNVSDEMEGSEATLSQTTGAGASIKRQGRVLRLLRELDPRGRMARVIVQIDDPMELALDAEERGLPLLSGAFVSVHIEGTEIEDVVMVPRAALREGRYIWVNSPENTLEIREVQVLWRGRKEIYINEGLGEGDQVIVSPLAAPVEGMALRTQQGSLAQLGDPARQEGDAEGDADGDAEGDAEGSELEVGPDVEATP